MRKKTFKKYFIPHHKNNYHPHILHTKRAVFYSLVFLLTKILVVTFVIMLPTEVFVLPDVLAEEQRQIITLTNSARADKGLPALAVADKLIASSQLKADDMATKEYFAHSKDNQSLATWLKATGYQYEVAGENLAVGFSTAEDIVNAWKNSPTHYANLIDADFEDLGVGLSGGVYNGQPTVFIAQHLAEPLLVEEVSITPKAVAVQPIAKKPVEVKPVVDNAPTAVLSATVENITPEASPVVNLADPTPVEKYIQAKHVLSPITSIFAVSKGIYFMAICFFVFALLLNIFIKIKKQRPLIIGQTCALIALLVIFWRF